MIIDLYTAKSFLVIGDSLRKCYGCDYCRADDDKGYSYSTLPSSINPLFRRLPVAVNLFYGDPVLQWDNTMNILKKLEKDNHSGVVTLITKGKLPEIPKFNLNLHVGISIGPDEVSKRNFEYNLIQSSDSWYKYSIEYRPICNGINDSEDVIDYILGMASKYNTCVAYPGLQLPPKGLGSKYIPYDGRKFSGQKYISDEVNDRIRKLADKYNVKIFKKTSCLISYMNDMERDYNSHYLKPVGVECNKCPMYDKCRRYKFNENIDLPFEYELKENDKYACSFVRAGLCKVPNKECLNMVGTFITPNVNRITRGDSRVIKWLTGCMVDRVNELIETPFLSDFWRL